MTIAQFQRLIADIYHEKDSGRGLDGTFMWFVEEIGELSKALKRGTAQEQAEEFADVFAWLATMANIQGIDLTEAVRAKYESGCPKCGSTPCACGR